MDTRIDKPRDTKSCFAAALSTDADTARAIDEVCERAGHQLGGGADLAMVFVSHHHGPEFAPVAAGICDRTGAKHLIGCTGEAIVGGGREVEHGPALSLWLAHLPGATVRSMHLQYAETPEGSTFVGWPDDLPQRWPERSTLFLLGDPFSFAADVKSLAHQRLILLREVLENLLQPLERRLPAQLFDDVALGFGDDEMMSDGATALAHNAADLNGPMD